MANRQYRSTAGSILGAIKQRFTRKKRIGRLGDDDRIDGKTVLITGASSGLGHASAVELARRGGKIIMAVRSGIPEKGAAVAWASGSSAVAMRPVDLADLGSIRSLADGLARDGVELDLLVLNAAMVPRRSRQTRQGLDEMFAVNYLSSFYLTQLLLERGVLRRRVGSRIVLVASEAHRSAPPTDWDGFGLYRAYGMRQVVALYGYYKHLLLAFACELARRLDADGAGIAVHALCPGPVRSNIAREAPPSLGWLLAAVFALFFKAPERACEPVVYLACARSLAERTGVYLHLMEEKSIEPTTADPENGAKLWEASRRLLEQLGHPVGRLRVG